MASEQEQIDPHEAQQALEETSTADSPSPSPQIDVFEPTSLAIPDDTCADPSWSDRCVVHGVYYWLTIAIFVSVAVCRVTWITISWWDAPMTQPVPREVVGWVAATMFFSPLIHIVAGWAEVRLNRKRWARVFNQSKKDS